MTTQSVKVLEAAEAFRKAKQLHYDLGRDADFHQREAQRLNRERADAYTEMNKAQAALVAAASPQPVNQESPA